MAEQRGSADPTQVVGRRIVGAGLDLAALVLVALATFLVVAERQPVWGGHDLACAGRGAGCVVVGDTALVATGGRLDLVTGVTVLFGAATFIVRRGRSGRSLGMDAVGLVVVDGDGGPPGTRRALVRTLVGWSDYLPVCVPLVGLVASATSPAHPRIGDVAAGTIVIRRDDAGRPGLVPARPSTRPDDTDRRGLRIARWAATVVGGLASALVLAGLWSLDLAIDGRSCGTVVTAVGRCDPIGLAFVVALTVGIASIPVLVVAGPFWVAELLRRRRTTVTTRPW